MALNMELIGLLACPGCKGVLTLLPKEDGLLCAACGVVYPINAGIPVMLVDDAVPQEKWTGSMPE